jgi:iron complex outermembrane recepter protein
MRLKSRCTDAVPSAWRLSCLLMLLVLLLVGGAGPGQAANDIPKTEGSKNPAEVLEVQQIEIIGTTPLPGSGVLLRKLPANAQVFTGRDLRQQRSTGVAEFLELNASSVNINAAQGNPYQPDVNFRGFTASPLLGTPQGLSVFLDGVRLNEPFGDAVNWDLIPPSAIGSIQVIPGANPAFGLNSLGGAVALYTKSGASEYPNAAGGNVTLSGGSFGRRTLTFETGGRQNAWDWFITGNLADDAGWAAHNPSRVRQLFAKLGWQDDVTDLDLTVVAAQNRLSGNQALPLSFSQDRRQAYTYPDENRNRAGLLAFKGSHALTPAWLVSGTSYFRRYDNQNFSSNVNADFGPDDPVQAFNERSVVKQTQAGVGVQLVHSGKLGAITGDANHKLALGLSVDQGTARYTRLSQTADFTTDRGTEGTSDFAPNTDADSRTRYVGAFVADAIELSPSWTLSVAARLNRADVRINDRSGTAPSLNGDHHFSALRPAVGISFNPSVALTAYANISQGMRAPTAMELTCADPGTPCRLPNNFLSDPPLKAVFSTTTEVGARGKSGQASGDTSWSLALYRTQLRDDLQFVSSPGAAQNTGYFQNVGSTQRQGIEVGGSLRLGSARPVTLAANYGLTDARFRSGFSANRLSNSSADANGTIEVRAGDQIPNIPRHTLKLRADWTFVESWRLVGQWQGASGAFARGDENNADTHGRVPGYGVFNLQLHGDISKQWSVFTRVDNLFDKRYANFGVLGQNVFTGAGQSFDPTNARSEQFRGWGTPRGLWVGVQMAWGGGQVTDRD